MQEPAEPGLTFVERSRRGACGISLGRIMFSFYFKQRKDLENAAWGLRLQEAFQANHFQANQIQGFRIPDCCETGEKK